MNVANYDETNLKDDPAKQIVLFRRGSKKAQNIIDSSKSSISVIMAITAAGQLLPPHVYKPINLYLICSVLTNSSGWFDSPTFEDWFDRILLRNFRNISGKKILKGDNSVS